MLERKNVTQVAEAKVVALLARMLAQSATSARFVQPVTLRSKCKDRVFYALLVQVADGVSALLSIVLYCEGSIGNGPYGVMKNLWNRCPCLSDPSFADLWTELQDQPLIALQDTQRHSEKVSLVLRKRGKFTVTNSSVFDPRRYLSTLFITEKANKIKEIRKPVNVPTSKVDFDRG